MPDPPEGLIGFERAVLLALTRIRDADVATPLVVGGRAAARRATPLPTDPDWAGGSLYVDERARRVDASPEALWAVIEGIGGDTGWYSFPLAWQVRGLLDRAVGGVGLRRGRRDPDHLYVGESLDFWRVEERDPGRAAAAARRDAAARAGLARPRGRHDDDGGTTYEQRALFHPRGLLGPRLLVVGRAVPRHRVRLDGAQHRARGRGARTPAGTRAGAGVAQAFGLTMSTLPSMAVDGGRTESSWVLLMRQRLDRISRRTYR